MTGLLDRILNFLSAHVVVEQGTSGIWTYRKFNDGVAECWGYKLTSGGFSSWGSIYSKDIGVENYPTDFFIESPNIFITSRCVGANTASGANSAGGTKTQTPGVTHVRGTSVSGSPNFLTFYHAIGKWK